MQCKVCGSKALSWQSHNRILTGCPVQQGRLNTNEVETMFVFGCDECSETIAVKSTKELLKLLNNSID